LVITDIVTALLFEVLLLGWYMAVY